MDVVLILALGLANWFGTLLLVESEFFRPLREWIERRKDKAMRKWPVLFWSKIDFMINCHMCAGTWVGLALAPFAPAILGVGVFQYLIVALIIKAIGHLFLVVHKLLEELTNESKTRRVAHVRAMNRISKGGTESVR